ncbi:MAG TPA: YggS family pyridoxal phosphate-dependent enzyme [Terriglobales bacterium]|nr:YggS family pyridoxal phosphate-dependent enzyme [Terriglobales bacterium]
MSIADKVARIRDRIATAAVRAGRDASQITLMAVSKTFPADPIREAHAAGIRVFGENRVQEFAGKAGALCNLAGARWHMIGHLQNNKASKAAELFHAVDSVDSLRLAEKLSDAATAAGKQLEVLLEINVGGEAAKSGMGPDSQEVDLVLEAAPRLPNLRIRGLMTLPPFTEDPQAARPYFRRLREIHDKIRGRRLPAVEMDVLSMGMSHDFEVAIEEGSTCVRVGTAIFGWRTRA